MADYVTIDPKTRSLIAPKVVTDALAGGAVQTPQDVTPLPPSTIPGITGRTDAPPEEPTSTLDDLTQVAPTPAPTLAPAKKSFGQKVLSFLPAIGVVGGAMEAAGGPVGARPVGAEMLEDALTKRNAAILKNRDLEEVEKPKAQAQADYYRSLNPTKEKVATIGAQSRENVAGTNAQSREKVANINASSKEQIAALQQGAPMTITPQMAQVAGQPGLAGQQLSGKSLSNFLKTFSAAGAGIHDLGDEGLWAVDKLGNRIARVSVSSPSVARADAFANAKANTTNVNVLRMDDNGNPYVTAITQAEQTKTHEPTANVENSVLGPTADERNKAGIAERARQAGQRVLEDLKDPNIRKKIGPLIGRAGSLENAIGIMPPELAETAQDLKSFAQFVGGQHPVRGLNALEAFEQAIGGIGQTPESLEAKINSQMKTTDFISKQGTIRPNRPNAPRTPQAQGAQKTKKDTLGILGNP